MSSESPSALSESSRPAFLQRAGVRQLVKFCIVGASSTVVDKGLFFALMTFGEHNAPRVAWWMWATASFCLGVSNGFFWNRRWTFRAARDHSSAHAQYIKFVFTNVIGLILNLSFTKVFLILFTGQVVHNQNPDKKTAIIASLCAVPIVVIWNFSAAKFWTFKAPKA